MNTTQCNNQNLTTDKTLANTCRELCDKLVRQIEQAKDNLAAEFKGTFATQQQLLRLAIVEADALAWQTDYPHLLFPTLAAEKIQQASQWRSRQKFLIRNTSPYALAA